MELAKTKPYIYFKISIIRKKKQNIKDKNLLSYLKISKDILTFSDINIENHKSYHQKSPIFSEDVDIENISI